MASNAALILDAVREAPRDAQEIVDATGIDKQTCKVTICKMVNRGELHRLPRGHRTLVRYGYGPAPDFVPKVDRVWPAPRVEKLRNMIANGLSAGQAAAELNRDPDLDRVSRNATIGKAHRIGLRFGAALSKAENCRRSLPTMGRPAPKAAVRTKAGTASNPRAAAKAPSEPQRFILAAIKSGPKTRAAPLPIRCEAPPANVVPLLQLGPHMCKWPLGDPKGDGFGFCGARRVNGDSYCATHGQQARQPTGSTRDLIRSVRRCA